MIWRKLLIGVVVPVLMLAVSILFRVSSRADYWHPWEFVWVLWLVIIVASSAFIGVGATLFWVGCRQDKTANQEQFDHDSVQLAADESTD